MIAYGLPSGSPTGSHPQCDYLPPPTHPKSGVAQKRGLFVGYRLPLPLQAHGSLHSWHFTPLRMACPIRSFGRVSDTLFSAPLRARNFDTRFAKSGLGRATHHLGRVCCLRAPVRFPYGLPSAMRLSSPAHPP